MKDPLIAVMRDDRKHRADDGATRLEEARSQLMRAQGRSYAQFEKEGLQLVVSELLIATIGWRRVYGKKGAETSRRFLR